jgi:hypothetical protein
MQLFILNFSELFPKVQSANSATRFAAIAWRKKSFRKYFKKDENYVKFHQLFARELEAPTEAIALLVQVEIVDWLKAVRVKEMRASLWFEKTWTGEHGYHTNASAGYVENNKASGCESHWKYAKRDTVGSAGSNLNMGMSLEVFAPSLIKYVGDTSGKHADKILCKKTGPARYHCGDVERCSGFQHVVNPVGVCRT